MLLIKKDFTLLLVGRVFQIIATLISLRLTTTLLSQAELGKLYYIFTIHSFFSLFLIGPVGQYFNRKINFWFLNGVLYKKFIIQVGFIVCVSVFSLLLMTLFFDLTVHLVILISIFIFSQAYNQTVVPTINMLGFRMEFVIYSLMTSFLTLALSCLFVVFYSETVSSWVLGLIVGNLIVAIYATKNFSKQSKVNTEVNIKKENFHEILMFCFPIAVATIFIWILNPGYRILVEKYYGIEVLAYLAVGLSVSNQIFSTAEALITQYLIPTLYKSVEGTSISTRIKHVSSYMGVSIPIYISLAVFFSFSVEYLFPYLVGPEYHAAFEIAIYGCWIECFRVLSNVLSVVGHIQNRTVKLIVPYMIGAAVFSITFFLLDDFGDTFNILDLLLLANFIALILMYFIMKTELNFPMPLKRVFLILLLISPSAFYFSYVDIAMYDFIKAILGGCIYVFGLGLFFYLMFFKKVREEN